MINRMKRYFEQTPKATGVAMSTPFGSAEFAAGDPFSILENLLSGFYGSPAPAWRDSVSKVENGLQLKLELPGYPSDQVSVETFKGVLYISAAQTAAGKTHKMKKSYCLPESADIEGITASLKDGVLAIFIPCRDEEGKKNIPIN